MINIEDVQSTVIQRLQAAPYLSGLTLLADDGIQYDAIDNALGGKGNGVAIVVSFPTDSIVLDAVKNLSAEDVGITVTIRVNSTRNAETKAGNPGAQKSLPLLLKAVRNAVISWAPPNNDRFGFISAGFQFAWEIDGEVGYYVNFRVKCGFQETA